MRFGCRFGLPHELKILHQNKHAKWEVCLICNNKFRWNLGYKSRIDNVAYLMAHARNFCQKNGATKRLYNKLYNPHKTIIHI